MQKIFDAWRKHLRRTRRRIAPNKRSASIATGSRCISTTPVFFCLDGNVADPVALPAIRDAFDRVGMNAKSSGGDWCRPIGGYLNSPDAWPSSGQTGRPRAVMLPLVTKSGRTAENDHEI